MSYNASAHYVAEINAQKPSRHPSQAKYCEFNLSLGLIPQVAQRDAKWCIPDFGRMDEAAMRTWWQEAAKLPEDMYPSSEK